MANNWKKIFAQKKSEANRLLKLYPDLNNNSGIYVFVREENNVSHRYIGQAKHLLDRLVSHLMGYSQHIDVSLKKRGLYPKGEWHIGFYNCYESELDEREKEEISRAIKQGCVLYNITGGGQGSGKVDINERKASKKYSDGLKQGYEKCRKEITEYFEKYLDYRIKNSCKTKKGDYSQISVKKINEFAELLKRGRE